MVMNTSGTRDQVYISVNDVISSAVRKCGVDEGFVTPAIIRFAKQNLFWCLQELNTRGTPIWAYDTFVLGFNQQQQIYELPNYVYNLEYVNWRQTQINTYTCTGGVDPENLTAMNYYAWATTTTSFIADLGSEAFITQNVGSAGIFFYGNQANTITIDWSLDGITWHTVFQETTPTAHKDGQWIWTDMNPQPNATYFRVSVASGETLALRSFYLTNLQSAQELPLNRMNVDTYGAYVNKNTPGQPLQYYFEKQINPLLYVWQEPVDIYDWQLTMKRKMVVQDPGQLTQQLDIPSWYQEGIVWQLAARLMMELPRTEVDFNRYPLIVQMAEEKMNLAMNAQSDGNPISLIPDASCYTV